VTRSSVILVESNRSDERPEDAYFCVPRDISDYGVDPFISSDGVCACSWLILDKTWESSLRIIDLHDSTAF
jgi:hypothetical protein